MMACASCEVDSTDDPQWIERFEFSNDNLDYYDGPLTGKMRCRTCARVFSFDCLAMIPSKLWHWSLTPVVSDVGEPKDPSRWWISVVEDRRGPNVRCSAVRVPYFSTVTRPHSLSPMAVNHLVDLQRNAPEAERLYELASATMKAEILRGVVCTPPAPRPLHQRCLWLLGHRLSRYDTGSGGPDDPRGWYFLNEPELQLGERPDKLKPDAAGWVSARATFSPQDAAIVTVPNWVCEVLSPSTETIDRGTKAPLYAEHGVDWLWLIDPQLETIEVFRNDGGVFGPVTTLVQGATNALPPFDAAPLRGLFEQ